MERSDMDQPTAATMTIRSVGEADRAEVELLAQRDSARVPDGPLVGIEIEGRLVVVTSLVDGQTVADPFSRTEEPRAMLELRAAQLRRPDGRAGRLRLRLPRRSRASLAGSPPGAGGRLLTLRTSNE
jgi:hypothetical protein